MKTRFGNISLAALLLIGMINVYRGLFSRVLGNCCRFYPSCSLYAIKALKLHGFLMGCLLAFVRICKCQPFHPGGFDPVPLKHKPQHRRV